MLSRLCWISLALVMGAGGCGSCVKDESSSEGESTQVREGGPRTLSSANLGHGDDADGGKNFGRAGSTRKSLGILPTQTADPPTPPP
jgi:hypothetical protein